MLIGKMGTGVGGLAWGIERRGGKQYRKHHMRSALVCMSTEYRTSKTCACCLWRVRQAKTIRKVMEDGKEKIRWKMLNGAVECLNGSCPSVQAGCTVKSRDGNAAVNIGLAAASSLLRPSRKILFPFEQTLSSPPSLPWTNSLTGSSSSLSEMTTTSGSATTTLSGTPPATITPVIFAHVTVPSSIDMDAAGTPAG